MPHTLFIQPPWQLNVIPMALGYPYVLKSPDSVFSKGVIKVDSEAQELGAESLMLRHTQGPILAQQFIHTSFDWRVGVLNGEVLFVCQYKMAPHHWQIIKRFPKGTSRSGGHVTLKPQEYPAEVCELALKAAKCLGTGLYGVDIKVTSKGMYLIECNDNPTIDRGVEDRYNEVWPRIVRYITRQGHNHDRHNQRLQATSQPTEQLLGPPP
jgi:glutathione synthase/RimK-type ligase-like ATP-grasp enzyme